jgi:hypothetical protein
VHGCHFQFYTAEHSPAVRVAIATVFDVQLTVGTHPVFTCACGTPSCVRRREVQAGSFLGSGLVPLKWCCLVPPRRIEPVEITSGHPQGASQTQTVGWQGSIAENYFRLCLIGFFSCQ